MVRKVPPIWPAGAEYEPPLPPNRRSKKPPCWPASAAERYCAPQPLSPSATSSDCRCAARSVVPPLSCSSWFCWRSRALRCWSICRLKPPHCAGGLLKIEKKPELSQPIRRDCATSLSTSNCWRLTASCAALICWARAGSLLPRSREASWVSSRWQFGLGDCANAAAPAASIATTAIANLRAHPVMTGTLTLKSWALRASCFVRPCRLCAQIPQHAGDDDQGTKQHEYVEPFAVKRPADNRD